MTLVLWVDLYLLGGIIVSGLLYLFEETLIPDTSYDWLVYGCAIFVWPVIAVAIVLDTFDLVKKRLTSR